MKDILRLAIVLACIAGGAGLILAQVYDVTKEPIAEVRRQAKLNALKKVLTVDFDNDPGSTTVEVDAGTDKKGNPIKNTYYIAKKGEQTVGVAFEVVATDGYAGNITSMVGVDTDGKLLYIEVLNHAETPGLGDKYNIPKFKDQLVGRDVSSEWRCKKDGGDIDTNSGATVTPRAILGSVARGVKTFADSRDKIVQ